MTTPLSAGLAHLTELPLPSFLPFLSRLPQAFSLSPFEPEELRSSKQEWSSRPLGLVEVPGLCGRMPWQVQDSLLENNREFLLPISSGGQTALVKTLLWFDYRLFLRWGLQRNWLLFGFRFHHSSSLRKPAEKEAKEMLS